MRYAALRQFRNFNVSEVSQFALQRTSGALYSIIGHSVIDIAAFKILQKTNFDVFKLGCGLDDALPW